ncbi:hypothetical protein D5018_20515 [Parashewanella curva]|uniref:Uncharacterized protein n=1 Tax=Parashewanella curva TaxID=2338552 RepID=A0A3L8PSM0_9GAMM|nr:hypothetical protein [Parashewanella curva]RLV57819.1 hypothetical protein D5018_20515 [Parashewanella curva]
MATGKSAISQPTRGDCKTELQSFRYSHKRGADTLSFSSSNHKRYRSSRVTKDKDPTYTASVSATTFHEQPTDLRVSQTAFDKNDSVAEKALKNLLVATNGEVELTAKYTQEVALLVPNKRDWFCMKEYKKLIELQLSQCDCLKHLEFAQKLYEKNTELYSWLQNLPNRLSNRGNLLTATACFLDYITVAHYPPTTLFCPNTMFCWRNLPDSQTIEQLCSEKVGSQLPTTSSPIDDDLLSTDKEELPLILEETKALSPDTTSSDLTASFTGLASKPEHVKEIDDIAIGAEMAKRHVKQIQELSSAIKKLSQSITRQHAESSEHFSQLKDFRVYIPKEQKKVFDASLFKIERIQDQQKKGIYQLYKKLTEISKVGDVSPTN